MNDNGVHTKLTDIAGELRGETEKAFRIYDGKTTEWVPKSQVEQNDDGHVQLLRNAEDCRAADERRHRSARTQSHAQ